MSAIPDGNLKSLVHSALREPGRPCARRSLDQPPLRPARPTNSVNIQRAKRTFPAETPPVDSAPKRRDCFARQQVDYWGVTAEPPGSLKLTSTGLRSEQCPQSGRDNHRPQDGCSEGFLNAHASKRFMLVIHPRPHPAPATPALMPWRSIARAGVLLKDRLRRMGRARRPAGPSLTRATARAPLPSRPKGRCGQGSAIFSPAHPRGSEDPGLRPVHTWSGMCSPIPTMSGCIERPGSSLPRG